jgi:hypothetical protein
MNGEGNDMAIAPHNFWQRQLSLFPREEKGTDAKTPGLQIPPEFEPA